MWRTLLVTTWLRIGREAADAAQAAEAARVARSGVLAGALAGASAAVAMGAASAPQQASIKDNAREVDFTGQAPRVEDACSVHPTARPIVLLCKGRVRRG